MVRPAISFAWLVCRITAAAVMFAGYFAIGIGSFAAALYFAIHLNVSSFFQGILAGLCFWILFELLPRPYSASARGPQVKPDEHPALFERIHRIAQRVGQPPPAEVYVTDEADAWIQHRGGWFPGRGPLRVMGIGLPILYVLTVSEFDAILAHEFGHFRKDEPRLAFWIYKARAGMEMFAHTFLFGWYAALFLRCTKGLGRIPEIEADRFAAAAFGSRVYAQALNKLNRSWAALRSYLHQEILPAIERGYQPPIIEGLQLYAQHDSGQSAEPPHPFDPHPPLAERLAAIEGLPAEGPPDSSPATSLLNDAEQHEGRLILWHLDVRRPWLVPVSWRNVGDRVVIPAWDDICREHYYKIWELCLRDLPGASRELSRSLLIAAFGSVLRREGWQLDHAPGQLRMRRTEASIDLNQLTDEMRSPTFTTAQWNEMLEAHQLDPGTKLQPR